MNLISLDIKGEKDLYRNASKELISSVDFYYSENHLKIIENPLLERDLDLDLDQVENIGLKSCLLAYNEGLQKLFRKYGKELLDGNQQNKMCQNALNKTVEYSGEKYEYCIYIWPGTYNFFIDVARALQWKMNIQGLTTIISEEFIGRAKRYIIFGANACTYSPIKVEIPDKSIIYNLEQLYENSPHNTPLYREILRNREIWDYSSKNIEWLKKNSLGSRLKHVKLTYAPTLQIHTSTLTTPLEEDIDVLFFGSVNQKRKDIFEKLTKSAPNLKVIFANNIWGFARNALIMRAKIILNIHYYSTGILETPRISLGVANKKFIISESCNSEDEMAWPGIKFVSYEKIVETILNYIYKPEECKKLAKIAYNHFLKSSFL
ncbi:glycosyltransferase family 1 protein [Bacillus mycoides]|uniref:glycosyltransferase family 1 protein n=1 Tax=Bacillus mycoides TaxID=1405 RepID=UPI0011A385E1|nr:glycosyltransferase family 1 protein [Bacillus mycoides]